MKLFLIILALTLALAASLALLGLPLLAVLTLVTTIAGGLAYLSLQIWLNARERIFAQNALLLEASKISKDNIGLVVPGQGYLPIANPFAPLPAIALAPATAANVLADIPGPLPVAARAISLRETLASLPRNQLALCFGVDAVSGQMVNSTLLDSVHILNVGGSGMGKSYQAGSLLTQLITLNRPDQFRLYIADIKRTTQKWFAPHAYRVAVEAETIVALLGEVFSELNKRIASDLTGGQTILLLVEEALATQQYLDRAQREEYNRYLNAIALLGREMGIFLMWAAQVDYASSDLKSVRGQFASRMAGAVMPRAAQSMGFIETEKVNELWAARTPGRFLLESPAGARIILAPRLDMRGGELTELLPRPNSTKTATPPAYQNSYSDRVGNFYGGGGFGGVAQSAPAPAPGQGQMQTSIALPAADPDLLRAYQAYKSGNTSAAKMASALGLSSKSTGHSYLVKLRDAGLI